jgi:hypothetical protein
LQAVDDVLSDNWQAIQDERVFPAGISRLYFFFDYENLAPQTEWGQLLLRNGQVIQQRRQFWGQTPENGQSFFFFGDQRGFELGNYEMRLTYGADQIPVASLSFTVIANN